ncbi:MAG: hypothetical protein DBP02_17760 [gamma proteobacterium symbiont of Ctena orbiculata]|nr:MAG: hypothetical protein DBP02_17760 [gamma proteobacterium symbiont of Ctena orbiculata]
MITAETIAKAMEVGRKQADKVIRFRDEALETRARAVRSSLEAAVPRAVVQVEDERVARLGPEGVDILVAEGDSWFDYPMNDILRILEDDHGYDVESVAHKGDRVEEMAYADGQLEQFTRRIEKLLRRGTTPRAILLSGGGNDVAGKEFGMLVNHATSAIAGLNDSIVDGVIDERAKLAFVTIITNVTSICQQRIGRMLPIVVHGYDYPVPDGRGFLGGWWFLPGPWLEPGFREKGFETLEKRIELARELIDRFNKMLSDVTSLAEFDHVHYVDLRGTLSTAADYKEDWANELHPTGEGFQKVSTKIAEVIAALP